MGNEAIAAGAIHAGVGLVSGYPGTPSTEILESAAKEADGRYYVEWSTNEKAALEVAAGASYSGARTLVTMKQVGLNVASDPLMSLAYVGVKGGMVIVSADDPGPISSQTEQDTRHFARFSKLPCFDPSSPDEAYEMTVAAYDVSERYNTPVLLRPTTRVCHGCASVKIDDEYVPHTPEGFMKDTQRWVIFPRTSYLNHIRIEERTPILAEEFSASPFNKIEGNGKIGVACGGISYAYVTEAVRILGIADRVSVLKIGTPFPFPEKLAVEFIKNTDKILVSEELDPVIERELVFLCGKHNLPCRVYGKYTGHSPLAGENTVESVTKYLADFCGIELPEAAKTEAPALPVRPPVLCAGCPHRASFLAVKHAMKGRKAVFSGDIGCYTLGNAKPLDMVDTCLCMGADVTIAQGIHRIEPDTVNFSFIGDSTFFASGMTGVANAVYNDCDLVLMVLDNSITAMTGGQPHPGTGRTMMGTEGGKIDLVKVLEGLGVSHIEVVNPFDFFETVNAVKEAADKKGVKAVICKAPCVNLVKPGKAKVVNDRCVGCRKCINETGCPALVRDGKKVVIESGLCTGCGLCANVCPAMAIE
ncbi:MAG: indolepyruvate ferredoxin oxidoreductase subunit alpha [Clostridia bacterium]|nr:indolepyruvate ferredoxin oxidoreductase subunit alpha [Clostridia bacterium]